MKKIFIAAMLVGLSVSLGACSKSAVNQSSVATVTNSSDAGKNTAAAPIENKSVENKQSGGQITVIAGVDKNALKMRSTRFR